MLSLQRSKSDMMKRFYYITFVAILAILCLQGIYVYRVYTNYINDHITTFEDALTKALDDELFVRRNSEQKSMVSTQIVLVNYKHKLSSGEKDSLKKWMQSGDTININAARKRQIGLTTSSLINQGLQDFYLSEGHSIDLPLLNKLIDNYTHTDKEGLFPHRLLLLNNKKTITKTVGNKLPAPVYTTKLFAIGTKGQQYVQMEIAIPMSDFLVSQIWTLVLSALCMLIALTGLFYQLVIIRKKNQELKNREQTVNGTIHDLKAPLNSILSLLEWMKRTEKDATKGKVISLNLSNVRRMVGTIEALLQLARPGHRDLSLNKTNVCLPEIARGIKDELDMLYADKAHTILINNKLPEGIRIYADKMYLENVFRNLMENALKYADEGVKVQVTLRAEGEKLEVSVKDNGWGIPDRYRKKLFKAFFRVPRTDKAFVRGYGIGLAQTLAIIKVHKGSIHVTCPEEGGSIFTFQIPLT